MAGFSLPSSGAGRRRHRVWLILPLLAGAAAAALLSGRQAIISALPLLFVAGFYFAIYRGGRLRDSAPEPAAGRSAPSKSDAPAPEPAVEASASTPAIGRHSLRAALAALRPRRRAKPADADLFGRLAVMAAAERRREELRRLRPGT